MLEAANQNKPVPSGKLAENIMHFARILREAGLPIGPAGRIRQWPGIALDRYRRFVCQA